MSKKCQHRCCSRTQASETSTGCIDLIVMTVTHHKRECRGIDPRVDLSSRRRRRWWARTLSTSSGSGNRSAYCSNRPLFSTTMLGDVGDPCSASHPQTITTTKPALDSSCPGEGNQASTKNLQRKPHRHSQYHHRDLGRQRNHLSHRQAGLRVRHQSNPATRPRRRCSASERRRTIGFVHPRLVLLVSAGGAWVRFRAR